jgi:hypothetical protein
MNNPEKSLKIYLNSLIVFLILVFPGCDLQLRSSGGRAETGQQSEIKIIFINPASNLNQKTVLPPLNNEIARYHIECSGPEDLHIEQTTDADNLTINPITPGNWTLNVSAFNNEDNEVGRGGKVVLVPNACATIVEIEIELLEGPGTLDMDLSWAEAEVVSPSIDAVLSRVGETGVQQIVFELSGTSALFFSDDIDSGSYLLSVQLMEAETCVWGTIFGVVVIKNGITQHSIQITGDMIKFPPSAPTGLELETLGVDFLNLHWMDNSLLEEGFIIERREEGDAVYSELGIKPSEDPHPVNTSSFRDESIEAGKTYSYRIRAYNAWGESDYSNELSVYSPVIVNASSAITEDTLWVNTQSYRVSSDVYIYPNASLTVEEGTRILFDGDYSITVLGSIVASGTDLDRIEFTSYYENAGAGAWGTIRFADACADVFLDETGNYVGGSVLKYCIIKYGSGIIVEDSFPYFENVTIDTCAGSTVGSYVDEPPAVALLYSDNQQDLDKKLVFRNSTVSDCTGSGFLVMGSELAIGNIEIVQCGIIDVGGQGILCADIGDIMNIDIDANRIEDVQGAGIEITGSGQNMVFRNNTIIGCESGIYIDSSPITVEFNAVELCAGRGVDVFGSDVTIRYNTIKNNYNPHGSGMYIDGCLDSEVHHNTVEDNFGISAVYMKNNDSIMFYANNLINPECTLEIQYESSDSITLPNNYFGGITGVSVNTKILNVGDGVLDPLPAMGIPSEYITPIVFLESPEENVPRLSELFTFNIAPNELSESLVTYNIVISDSIEFNNTVYIGTADTPTIDLTGEYFPTGMYYWQVSAASNGIAGPFSASRSFNARNDWLSRYTAFGTGIWPDTDSWEIGRDILHTSDGGYLIAGNNEDWYWGSYNTYRTPKNNFFFQKRNFIGHLEWSQLFGSNTVQGDEICYAVGEAPNGDFMAAGVTDVSGAGENDIYLIRLDSLGGLVWQKTYGGPSDDAAYSLAALASDEYIIGGTTESFGNTENACWIIKIDGEGSIVWENTYGLGVLYDVVITSGGDFIFIGSTSGESPTKLLLLCVDGDGNLLWRKEVSDMLYAGIAVSEMTDGTYIITGNGDLDGDTHRDIFTLNIDEAGNFLSGCVYEPAELYNSGYPDIFIIRDVEVDEQGSIYLAGPIYEDLSYSDNDQWEGSFICKISSGGNPIWFRQIDVINSDIYSLESSPLGGFFMTGHQYTGSWGKHLAGYVEEDGYCLSYMLDFDVSQNSFSVTLDEASTTPISTSATVLEGIGVSKN